MKQSVKRGVLIIVICLCTCHTPNYGGLIRTNICPSRLTSVSNASVSKADVLKRYRVIAVVGASKNPEKEAHAVPAYLKLHGYTIIPINPTSQEVLGEKAYGSLLDIPPQLAKQVDVVEVFRPSEELPEVAKQTAEFKRRHGRPFVFWAQLGLENEEAKKILAESGIAYVMNACMRIEHQKSVLNL